MIGNAMLVTTCPDCSTTFRLSTEILAQANGQVRCGHCSKIFDGNSSLRELEDKAPSPEPRAHQKPESGAAPDAAPTPGTPIEQKLQRASVDAEQPGWLRGIVTGKRRIWPWAVAASLMALTLAGQFLHQFRTELVGLPTIGPIISGAYAQVGMSVAPPVDLDQYDLLDLTAAAQPLGEGPGWLIIETRVINEGPRVQPYPHIFVRLLDRWDATVSGRYFGPEEYAVSTPGDVSSMHAGATVDAQFVIMDPGPSATGFELEICTQIEQGFICESDVARE
jgi:predicted Zn finger-like uncharacterized protein